MAWNGSGSFVRANGATEWQDDAALGTGIEAGLHDAQDNDLAGGVDNCLAKDGQNQPTTNLPMGGFKHTNVGTATARTEYTSLGQIQDKTGIWGGTTGGGATNYTLTLSPAIPAYVAGQSIKFIPNVTNVGAATLNINGLGAVVVYRPDGTNLSAGDLLNTGLYEITYTGSSFTLTNYTPSWITIATSLLQNGAGVAATNAYCKYLLEGKKVTFIFHLAVTGTGTAGTIINVSLPFTASGSSLFRIVGSGHYYDSSTGTSYILGAFLGTTTRLSFTSDTSGGNNFGTVPSLAVDNGDFISGMVIYEGA